MIQTPIETAPAPGEAIEVADGVLWLRIPLPMVLDHVNVYALREDDGWTLVDTGLDTGKTRAIWEAALAGPLKGLPVRRLIVTHHHPDHVGLAGWFQARGAELWMTRTAWLFARMLTLDEQPLPTGETLAYWRGAGMAPDIFEARRAERPFNFADVVHPMPLGFTRLAEGDVIEMGGRTWDIRLGQGHAADHATFWSRDDELVIGGDQLLATISAHSGSTRPAGGPIRWASWLGKLRALKAHAREGGKLVLPGHKACLHRVAGTGWAVLIGKPWRAGRPARAIWPPETRTARE